MVHYSLNSFCTNTQQFITPMQILYAIWPVGLRAPFMQMLMLKMTVLHLYLLQRKGTALVMLAKKIMVLWIFLPSLNQDINKTTNLWQFQLKSKAWFILHTNMTAKQISYVNNEHWCAWPCIVNVREFVCKSSMYLALVMRKSQNSIYSFYTKLNFHLFITVTFITKIIIRP